MMKATSWILGILAVSAMHANAQLLTAQVLPEKPSFDEIFAASHRFYPGQRVRIQVDGQVDANHRYWQDRECSWFGLKCKYVNREASNLMDVSRLPLMLRLDSTEALTKPEQTNEPKWYANTDVKHLPVESKGVYDFVIELPGAASSVEAFAAGSVLRAVVADNYDGAVPINRGQCHNRPPQCSSGAYKVTVSINNDERLKTLQALLLKTRRSAADILNRRVMDPLFVQDSAIKPGIADALFNHANSFHKDSSNEARREFLAISSFASGLDPTRSDILNAIASTYIALGEFTEATKTIEASLAEAGKHYKGPGTTTPEMVISLSDATGMKASVWAQERAGVVGTDLLVAVSLYRESSGYCLKEAALDSMSPANKQRLYTCAKDQLINAGRTLAMLRTRDNLVLAEQLLTEAQEAAQLAVDKGGA